MILLFTGFLGSASEATPQPEPEAAPAEVNWPGTTIPRSQFKAMQRAALARALAAAREERERAAEGPKPVKKAAKKEARRIIRRLADDGLLSDRSLRALERPISQAVSGAVSFTEMMRQFEQIMADFETRNQAVNAQYDDEATAILLLAA